MFWYFLSEKLITREKFCTLKYIKMSCSFNKNYFISVPRDVKRY